MNETTAGPGFHRTRRAPLQRPSWRHPLRYVSGRLRETIESVLADVALPGGARVLDYGCADMPYRDALPAAVEYVGADLRGNELATLELTADGAVPAADASFDLVLSSQVLEHVVDPRLYLAECRRVLRPAGRLVLSTHGLFQYHPDPTDFWRWTSDGLRKALGDAGFRVLRFEGVLGMSAAGLQIFMAPVYMSLPRALRPLFAFVMQGFVALFDRLHSRDARAREAGVYVVLAETAPHG